MDKQKTLIFSLLVMLFLAASFIAYSWTEPTTPMPSGYTTPLNTSSTAQTKNGEIGASIFRDAENQDYYIDAGGVQSILAGKLITESPTLTEDVPNSVATKGYVDNLLSDIGSEISLSNVTYIFGDNPSCPEDSAELMRHWLPKTCGLTNTYGYYYSCTTGMISFLGDPAPSCSFNDFNYNNSVHYCTSDTSEAVLCAKAQDFLFNSKHTESQCSGFGGTVVTVEDNIKICKIPVTTQCYKQLDYSPEGPCQMSSWEINRTRTAVYECPSGWKKYKNFVTTKSKTWYPQDIIYMVRTTNGREQQYACAGGDPCTSNSANERVFSDKSTIDACGVYCDTSWNELDGYYYGQAEVVEAGCY